MRARGFIGPLEIHVTGPNVTHALSICVLSMKCIVFFCAHVRLSVKLLQRPIHPW